MAAGPRIDSYQWSGAREAMLRWGPEDGPVVIAALPLLEEANRTRAFVVAILRALAERGIGGVLPDLPGQGESLVATQQMRLADLRAAFAAAARASGGRVYGLAVRSGAMSDSDAELQGRWHLSPQTGEEVLHEWRRLAAAGLEQGVVAVAGNLISPLLTAEIAVPSFHPREGGDPASVDNEAGQLPRNVSPLDPSLRGGGGQRVIRFNTDPRPADLKIEGAPLWRRAEPNNDPALARRLAADIAEWIATCGG